MIVLDAQLSKRSLREAIKYWYPGEVCSIMDLRPGTVIKDEAIPALLSHQQDSTFVTINVADFWLQVPISDRFCVVCAALPDPDGLVISRLLRRLLRRAEFRIKAKRMGCVVRITEASAAYYTAADRTIRHLEGW